MLGIKFPTGYLGSCGRRYEAETRIYYAAHPTMTPAEVAALDVEIKAIKSGTPLTLSSLALNLSLVAGAQFITRASVDLNRYSGISGVQYSVAATGTPATTAVYSEAITAGTGETVTAPLNVSSCSNSVTYPYGTFNGETAAGFHVVGTTGAIRSAGTADEIVWAAGKLLKFSCSLSIASGGAPLVSYADSHGGTPRGLNAQISAGNTTRYDTMTNSTTGLLSFYHSAGNPSCEYTISNLGVVGVLTPDTTGILAAALTDGGINANSATYVVTVSKP